MTKFQGWVIIAELGVLLYGLYYGAQQVQTQLNNPALTGVENFLSNIFPARPQAAAPSGVMTPIA